MREAVTGKAAEPVMPVAEEVEDDGELERKNSTISRSDSHLATESFVMTPLNPIVRESILIGDPEGETQKSSAEDKDLDDDREHPVNNVPEKPKGAEKIVKPSEVMLKKSLPAAVAPPQ